MGLCVVRDGCVCVWCVIGLCVCVCVCARAPLCVRMCMLCVMGLWVRVRSWHPRSTLAAGTEYNSIQAPQNSPEIILVRSVTAFTMTSISNLPSV